RRARRALPHRRPGRDGHADARGRDAGRGPVNAGAAGRGGGEAGPPAPAGPGARPGGARFLPGVAMTVPQSTLDVPVARWPRDNPLQERLLAIDPRGSRFQDRHVGDLSELLAARDLVVVNDAATLPASLFGNTGAGDAVELRLLEAPVEGQA